MTRPLSSLWLTLLVVGLAASPASAQNHHQDYDDVDPWAGFERPGPSLDSASVGRFLAALATADPVVCRMAVTSRGNPGGSQEGDDRVGVLAGEIALEP